MPKIKYVEHAFSTASTTLIDQANVIIAEYAAQGYDLTLRQLYYQYVSRGLIPNNLQSYKRLGATLNDARLAGLIDWDTIEDRTRRLRGNSHWSSPHDIVDICARTFAYDKWLDQPVRVEIWIEKDALAGVFEGVCRELDVPYFSCRGYCSQSEMWAAGQRLAGYAKRLQTPIIFHFGDHDPSGLDMSRDIQDRLRLFMGGVRFERLALNLDQVEEYEPPPNPAKTTDVRAAAYIDEYGDESWELDALDPATLNDLAREAVLAVRDETRWQAAVEREQEARRLLGVVATNWADITEGL